MKKFEIVVTTLFGIESVCANEIRRLGYETTSVEDGRITFLGDYEAVCRANLWLRTGERVYIKVGEFKAFSFDELFDQCKALDWAEWIPRNGAFPVKGFTNRSTLFSVSDCQSILKKSVAEALSREYGQEWLPEDGTTYQIEFSIIKDKVVLMIDTSGDGLHKRGYRRHSNAAPVKETIAAAMVILSRFKYSGIFADPFCGSGTLPIEAGLIAKNIAPGLYRKFAAEQYAQIPKAMWSDAREEAQEEIRDSKLRIVASDIDPFAVELTRENCKKARISDLVTVEEKAVKDFACGEAGGTIVCNPPYGERLLEKDDCEQITQQMGEVYRRLDNWSLFALTPLEQFEYFFGGKASKKRKLYNGMIKCNLYQYFPNVPKR